jgi:hypothetical protein
MEGDNIARRLGVTFQRDPERIHDEQPDTLAGADFETLF